MLYGMIITDVTALVLEVPCAECFHRKKILKNGNRTEMQVTILFMNVYICYRHLEPCNNVDFFHREEGCEKYLVGWLGFCSFVCLKQLFILSKGTS